MLRVRDKNVSATKMISMYQKDDLQIAALMAHCQIDIRSYLLICKIN